jgi:DNA adenine methylase
MPPIHDEMPTATPRRPARPKPARKLTPPLKWHGGKNGADNLAKQIVALMPPRAEKPNGPAADDPGWVHYVEPYFGGGAVLLEMDPEGISEVANDLHRDLTNFWRVLQDPAGFERFRRIVDAMPFSEVEWDAAGVPPDGNDPVARAVAFFVRCRQSLAGRMKGFTSVSRDRTRRGMNEQASAWWNAVEGLPAVHARLRRVLILNRPALEVIRSQDGRRTLFYLDPPYPHETRTATKVYALEMGEADHAELLGLLAGIKGRFLLSGYHSDLYDRFAAEQGWHCTEFTTDNKAAGGKQKRRMTECVWANYPATGSRLCTPEGAEGAAS